MKTLFLIRHAKSDWPINVPDFDRPLNERGHKNAPKMAKFLKNLGLKMDEFVTSPAKRALTTCKYFSEVFENDNIRTAKELYDASPSEFSEVIEHLNDETESVAIFSHNNGITYFANSLTNKNIAHMPTCAIVAFRIDTESWQDFKTSKKEFLFFHTPKEI